MSHDATRAARTRAAVGLLARSLLGAVLLFSAISKTFDATAGEGGPARFATLIESHRVVPATWAPTAAWAVLIFEALLGVLLLLPRPPRAAAPVAALLLGAFSVYLVVVHIRQGAVHCGCFGRIDSGDVWSGLTRNALLIASAWLATACPIQPARDRMPVARPI